MTTLISISYCADHSKGPPQWNVKLPAAEHAEMLRDCVQYMRGEVPGAEIAICACGGNEDDVRLLHDPYLMFDARVYLRREPTNPGYSEGATLAIRQALDVAKEIGCDTMLHLCEDVVPYPGVCQEILGMLSKSADVVYVGERWRPGEEVFELSTQFFAADCDFLLGWRYPFSLPPEAQMGGMLGGHRFHEIGRVYDHTHTFADYKAYMAKARSGHAR